MNVQEACEKALMEHWRRLERRGYKNRGISVIAMDHQGNTGAATTLEEFPFVVAGEDGCRFYVASMDQETGKHFLFAPDEEWLKNYAPSILGMVLQQLSVFKDVFVMQSDDILGCLLL